MHYISVQLPNLPSRLVALYGNNNLEYKQVFSLCKTLFEFNTLGKEWIGWGEGQAHLRPLSVEISAEGKHLLGIKLVVHIQSDKFA